MRRIGQQHERGAAVVEMAFVTVLLILLVTGIVDVGRAIYTNIGLQDAAEEGAMYVSFNGPPSNPGELSDYQSYIVESTSFPELDPNAVTFSPCHDNSVAVTVSHTVDMITPIFGQFFGGSIDLSQEFVGDVFTADC